MDDDIVEQLRDMTKFENSPHWELRAAIALIEAQQAEIERLRHRVARLDAALDDITHLTTDRQVLHRIKEARRG